MSGKLVWVPVNQKMYALDNDLRDALRNKFGCPVDIVMDYSYSDFLEGLVCAGIKDAQKLIDAIEKHCEVRIKERY